MNSKYRNPKILFRKKGQRYDVHAFGGLTVTLAPGSVRGIPKDCKIEQVGEGMAYKGYAVEKSPVYYFEVTKPNGDVVPCYSFTSGTGEDGYTICQDFTHKIAKA